MDIERILKEKKLKHNLLGNAKTIEERMKARLAINLFKEKGLEHLEDEEEIIMIIATAKNFIWARYTYDVITKTDILNEKDYLKLIRIIAQRPKLLDEFLRYQTFNAVTKDSKALTLEEVIMLAKACLNASFENLTLIKSTSESVDFMKRENGVELVCMLAGEKCFPEVEYMSDYLKYHQLKGKDLHIVKMISEYLSLSRLEASYDIILKEDSLLEDDSLRDTALSTFEHFKDDENDYKLFSCLELFSKESDPTVQREIKQIEEKIILMEHEKQIETLNVLRKVMK